MRKHSMLTTATLIFILTLALAAAGPVLAGKGKGPGIGTGPIHDLLAGTPFQFTGDVIGMVPGDGMEIATANGNIKVYGIGPVRYWRQMGVDRPVVGDNVDVSGFTVAYNGVERNIAFSITIDDKTVQLRDPATGAPMWKGKGARR